MSIQEQFEQVEYIGMVADITELIFTAVNGALQ